MIEHILTTVGDWWLVAAIAVAILGVGRWSRVVVHDSFPPAMWFRQRWADWTVKHKHESWTNLFYCWWCFTPWLMLACIGWFFLTFLAVWVAWTWWIFWGWGALAYVSSIILARDEPAGGDE